MSAAAPIVAMARVFGVPVENVEESPEARKAFFLALDTLTSREAISVVLRASGMTLQAVGDILGCTGGRIKQNEAKGFRKLRHPTRISPMVPYVKDYE